ncbi:TPA: restriction endonuclease subunit M, partial [Escherichia coli]
MLPDQRPATSDQRPATSDQRPATSDRKSRKSVKSVEPDIADRANNWLKSYGLDYKLEQAPLNNEIDNALDAYFSKNGGTGGNRPDV